MNTPTVPVICTCGYDGKLTSPLCPLHGERGLTAQVERLETVNADLLRALERAQGTFFSAVLFIEGTFPESERSDILKQELISYQMCKNEVRAAIDRAREGK